MSLLLSPVALPLRLAAPSSLFFFRQAIPRFYEPKSFSYFSRIIKLRALLGLFLFSCRYGCYVLSTPNLVLPSISFPTFPLSEANGGRFSLRFDHVKKSKKKKIARKKIRAGNVFLYPPSPSLSHSLPLHHASKSSNSMEMPLRLSFPV